VYSVALQSGMSLPDIVDALNAEFATALRHRVEAGAALGSDAGGTAADDATAWADVHIGGSNAGIAAGDVITLSGTRTDGSAFLSSLTVSAGGTLAELRNAVQQALGSDVEVRWENGRLVAEMEAAGSKTFTLAISSDNAGGGNFQPGPFGIAQQGRSAVSIVASDEGGELRIAHGDYGAANGFEVSFVAGGADGSASLGLTAGVVQGEDVEGTIGGVPAQGAGSILTGAAGSSVEGIVLRYEGEAVGAVGTIGFSRGLAAQLESVAKHLLGSAGGSVASVTERIENSITRWQDRMFALEDRLDRRREQLIRRFTALEAIMARAQSQSAWLESQVAQWRPGQA
jgi:flagellar hook-associated protein 2